MYRISSYIAVALLLFPGLALLRAADAPNAGEARLRESLRAVTLQLRAAQADLATAQAAQAALADEKKTLTSQLEALRKQTNADKGNAEKTVADFKARVSAQDATVAQYRETIETTKAELQKATEAARSAQAHAMQVDAQNVVLERRAADRETKNLALFILANRILARYEDFSLGKALAAKEPFVGTTRVKLENLMQDYQDQINEQRATE